MLLTDEIKKQVLNVIDDIEVDCTTLDSYTYTPAIYSWQSANPQAEDSDWDEREEYGRKVETFLSYIRKIDRVIDYIDVDDELIELDLESRALTNAVIEWLENM